MGLDAEARRADRGNLQHESNSAGRRTGWRLVALGRPFGDRLTGAVHIFHLDELPRTRSMKVSQAELRALLTKKLEELEAGAVSRSRRFRRAQGETPWRR